MYGKPMGSYCNYCGHRCFVYRQVIVGGEIVWSGHMATCQRGMKHDRQVLGVDQRTAHNPYATGELAELGVEATRSTWGTERTSTKQRREDTEQMTGSCLQCRICGRFLSSGLQGMPEPLLPGDIPGRDEVCAGCEAQYGPHPAQPYTVSFR